MKSLLEFVACCVTTAEASAAEEGVATPSRREALPIRRRKKKKRVILVGTPGSTTAEWKPSLHVISEDYVVAEKKEKPQPEAAETVAANRVVKRKNGGGSRSKVHVRSYSDDIGRNSVQMAIPTFSPTPFMF